MKRIMKAVQPSYLHLSNILSSRVEFSNRVIESSFSTRFECLSSTSQFNSTLFPKNFNLTRHFSSRVLDLTRSVYVIESSSQLRAIIRVVEQRDQEYASFDFLLLSSDISWLYHQLNLVKLVSCCVMKIWFEHSFW